MKRIIFFLILFSSALTVLAQTPKPTRNIGREQIVPLSTTVGIPAIVDSSGKKVGRLINPDEIATNAQLSLKASQSQLSDTSLQIRSDLASKSELQAAVKDSAIMMYAQIAITNGMTINMSTSKTSFWGTNLKDGWYGLYITSADHTAVGTFTNVGCRKTSTLFDCSSSSETAKNGYILLCKIKDNAITHHSIFTAGWLYANGEIKAAQDSITAHRSALDAEAAARVAGDASKAPLSHLHTTSNITDFGSAVNQLIGNVVYETGDTVLASATRSHKVVYTNMPSSSQFASGSTFSGWSSEVGFATNFNAFKIKVKAFDAAVMPTQIRIVLKKSYAGNTALDTILDRTISVSLVHNVEQEIETLLSSVYTGTTSMWLEVFSNGKLSLSGSSSPTFSATTKAKYLVNNSLTGSAWTNTSGAASAYTIFFQATNGYTTTAINFLPLAENDMATKLGFVPYYTLTDSTTIGGSYQYNYQLSTFAGWGWYSEVTPTFNAVKLKVRGFDPADLPSQITVRVRADSSTGNIVAQKTANFVTNSNDEIIIRFDSTVTMTQTAWIEYVTDGKVGLYSRIATNPNPMTRYTTSQALGSTSPQTLVSGSVVQRGYFVFQTYLRDGWALENATGGSNTTTTIIQSNAYVPIMHLPKKLRATVGKSVQIFYKGIIEAVDLKNYNIKITGDLGGKPYPRYFEFTPTAVGNKTMIVTLYDDEGIVVVADTTTIEVKAAVQNPSTAKKILPIGDSLTDGGVWTGETIRMASGTGGTPAGMGYSNIQLIGTKGSGNNKYEGYGGKTWDWYSTATTLADVDIITLSPHGKTSADLVSIWQDGNGRQWRLETIVTANALRFSRVSHTFNPPSSGSLTYVSGAVNTASMPYGSFGGGVTNPFWNSSTSQLDFSNYVSTNGFGTIDGVVILLGWNQSFSPSTTVAAAKVLIDRLHSQYPAAKIKIVGLQLPSQNGGLANNYLDASTWSNAYEVSKRVWALNTAYENMCLETAYASFCEYVDIASQFDSEYNNQEATKIVNSRSNKVEFVGTNGVHPAAEGYYQIADAVLAVIIAEFCQ